MYTTKSREKEHRQAERKEEENKRRSSLIASSQPYDKKNFLRNKAEFLSNFIYTSVAELYHSLTMTFSLETVDLNGFKKYIWPVVSSGAALLIGDFVISSMSQYFTGSNEYDFIYKFMLGSAILSYSAFHRITEIEFKSIQELSMAVASEVLAIAYLYSATYSGTKMALSTLVSDNYSLAASLGTSVLFVPGSIAYLTQKAQEHLVRNEYSKGAQRSDTAVITSGRTVVANLYFQLNYFIFGELSFPRKFQFGLIYDNIINLKGIAQQFKNLPALGADLIPSIFKKLLVQKEKLKQDFQHNHTLHQVLRFTPQGSQLVSIPRYKLRRGDLVYCDKSIDRASVPVSGELIALERDQTGSFTRKTKPRRFGVNLMPQNGEDVWIIQESKSTFSSNYTQVDLHAIHEGKQPGVLVGDKLNLKLEAEEANEDNFFIQILPEKELILSKNSEKKSVINQIIVDRKQKSVFHAIYISIIMAGFLKRDVYLLPTESLRLLFTLFQTMIPFSESFLREAINTRLMKKLNQNLAGNPFETIDALRIADWNNAHIGYYKDRFPHGVVIVSDKTGTLTTNIMDVSGIWTSEMPADVSHLLKEKKGFLLPKENQQLETFGVFISAYTNNRKELEPEEDALLAFYKLLLNKENCLEVTTLGHNHLKKVISLKSGTKEIETFHGKDVFRSLGGRLTLVNDGENKYFVFCGVPKPDAFNGTPLFQAYSKMKVRENVLSRDWCIARTQITEEDFSALKELFRNNHNKDVESYITNKSDILKNLIHYGTFIIDNPVKKGAEHFIAQCRKSHVPVFVATGDTSKAAENIVRVLFPDNAKNIITIRANKKEVVNSDSLEAISCTCDSTVIFCGINSEVLKLFKKLLARTKETRPVILFAEMSTEGKGTLARFLKDHKYFVVANGDGSNDVRMMENADVVIGHFLNGRTFAPGVGPLSNVDEDRARRLLGSNASIYELLDIHTPQSRFFQMFAPLRTRQEKPSVALGAKFVKSTFDIARVVGATNVTEMYQQHWYSVMFDLTWLAISYYLINEGNDLPMDGQNISASNMMTKVMGISFLIATLEAFANYTLFEESTNLTSMIIMLSLLPLVLKLVFSGHSQVETDSYPEPEPLKLEDEQSNANSSNSIFSYIGTLFRPAASNLNSKPVLAHLKDEVHGYK